MVVLIPDPYFLLALVAVLITMIACVRYKKLTFPASLTAGLIGYCVLLGAGIHGVILLFTFFVLGVLATSHQKALKAKIDPAGIQTGGRKPGQVFANGGVAAIMGLLSIIDPTHADIYMLMLAASLASALADTTSSELGMVYGRNFYNVLTFKREPKGLDGVISLEGTLIGAAGAGVIALIYSGFDRKSAIVLLAGVLGNLMDSLLGASFERKQYIGNDTVNFLNTLFAAITGMLFYLLVR